MIVSLAPIAFELVLELLVASALFWAASTLAIRLFRIADPVWRTRFFALPVIAPIVVVPLIHLLVRPLLLELPDTPLENMLTYAFGFFPQMPGVSLAAAGLIVIWAAVQGFRPLAALGLLRTALANSRRRTPVWQRCEDVLANVASKLQVSPPRIILTGGTYCGTLTIGPFGSCVLVSRDLYSVLDDEELEALFAHEVAHIKRKDTLLAPLVGVCRRLLAFSPFAHDAQKNLAQAREEAVDDMAIRVTGRPLALASCLLKACRLSQARRSVVVPAANLVAPYSSADMRIRRLLEPAVGLTEPSGSHKWVFLGSIALVVALLLFAV